MSANLAVILEWNEHESGWGCRPDGYSFHLSINDAKLYSERVTKRQQELSPSEYSSAGAPTVCELSDELFERVKQAENNNYRLFRHEYNKLPSGSVVLP